MSTTLSNKLWQGTDRDALASGVLQMQIVQQMGRSPMRGIRVNEFEALCVRALAVGIDTAIDCDFSDKFARVDAVYLYNVRAGGFSSNTQCKATTGQQNPAKVTIVAATQANDVLLMTVHGQLLPTAT